MFHQRTILLFAVLVNYNVLKPLVSSFRVCIPPTNTCNIYCQITRLYSTADEIKSLYEKAQVEDAEWLQRVLGERPTILSSSDLDSKSQASKGNISDAIIGNAINSEAIVNLLETTSTPGDNSESQALAALGYTPEDIANMKLSVIKIVLESRINRPRRGLPDSWIDVIVKSQENRKIGGDVKDSDSSPATRKRIQSENIADNGRKPRTRAADNSERLSGDGRDSKSRQRNVIEGNRYGLQEEVPLAESTVGEAFAWNGSPPTEDELEKSERAARNFDSSRLRNSPQAMKRLPKKLMKSDWDDEKDLDSPSPFWPDVEEFKDMLLDESEWRSGLIGDWSVPFIREETKWRYKIYKNWLNFLDEGLGDGFDVVSDEFNEFYDDDSYLDEEGDRYQSDGRGRGTEDVDSKARTDDESDRIRDRKYSRTPGQRSDRPIRDAQSKADRYDAWVKQRVGAAGVWTDVEEEEWIATREKREAAERKRREEEYNDYRYDGRRRRTDREAGEELRRRVDFETDDDQPKGSAYDDETYRSARKTSAERKPLSDDDYQ